MTTLSVVGSTPDRPAPGTRPAPVDRLSGFPRSIACLVGQHGAALRRFAFGLTLGNRERAEDIYQETQIRREPTTPYVR